MVQPSTRSRRSLFLGEKVPSVSPFVLEWDEFFIRPSQQQWKGKKKGGGGEEEEEEKSTRKTENEKAFVLESKRKKNLEKEKETKRSYQAALPGGWLS